jgi:hypothetical protein
MVVVVGWIHDTYIYMVMVVVIAMIMVVVVVKSTKLNTIPASSTHVGAFLKSSSEQLHY